MPIATVIQDGFTASTLKITESPRPWIVPGTNIANRMKRKNTPRRVAMARKASAADRPIGRCDRRGRKADEYTLGQRSKEFVIA